MAALAAMVEEEAFPPALIVNASAENLVAELRRHRRSCAAEIEKVIGGTL